jgi:N-acetylglucosaminyldiphosphoundecaprenol N-acetyl-beta-D-mannosaminyltransferase
MMLIKRDVYCLLGLPFDNTSLNNAVGHLSDVIDAQESCFLSTPNLNFVVAAHSDQAFYNSVVESDFVIVDGMPLIWVAKLLGLPFKERVAGSTLFNELQKIQVDKPMKVFFFGGEDGIAELAHNQLNSTYSAIESCGFHDPGFVPVDEMSSPEIIDRINQAAPDFVLVALGAKKGQAWIQANRGQITAPVISHLGAVINFVAGHLVRAPERWQNLGLEWLWRIKQEPSLWKRYGTDGLCFARMIFLQVLPLAIYDRVLLRRYRHQKGYQFEQTHDNKVRLSINGSVSICEIEQLKLILEATLVEFSSDVVINCLKLRYIDSAFIGTLLLYQSQLNQQGRHLSLSQVNKSVRRILGFNNVSKRFEII